jgi:hypothetical protein
MLPAFPAAAPPDHLTLEDKALGLRRAANAARARLLAQKTQLERARRDIAELRARAAARQPSEAAPPSAALLFAQRLFPVAALLLAALLLQKFPVEFRARPARRAAPIVVSAPRLAR